MPREPGISASTSKPSKTIEDLNDQKASGSKRTSSLWLALLVLLLNGSWTVYYFQYCSLPVPLTAEQAGKRGFSEVLALEHVKHLTELGPHPVGSDALDLALEYVLSASENIKKTAHWEVDVQVDLFAAKTGANNLVGGLFKGKTLVYSDLKHVVLRILPKYLQEAEENVILVSSHIDTVFSTGGAGDCSSCVGVMLELARGISQWAHGFKNGIIFLFNTGEEEGLNGAHSFITQHPWRNTIRFVVDLEAMGVGGKSSIFQSGVLPWAVETFANVAKYPSGQIVAQDMFQSGVVKSATDFQVYKEVAGLPGLDLAFSDSSAVYHTKNDKLKLLKPGSLQHLGENMLAFLLHAARSPNIHQMPVESDQGAEENNKPIYFDVLGMYMIVYPQRLASMLSKSVMVQALLLWATSLFMGGYPGLISFGLSCLSLILMWLLSLALSMSVAFIVPLISSSPVPYIASPWLVVGLFGAPAVLGAIAGQHIGFLFLQKYLRKVISQSMASLSLSHKENLVKWEAERWIFKAGFIQWLVLLFVGNFYKVGSSYLALVWLVCPSFAYGLMEATLSPVRLPKQLKIITLILGLTVPFILSSGVAIRLVGTITGTLVRFDRNPGSVPEWLGSVILAAFIASMVCLMLVYLLSYVHISGVKGPIMFSVCAIMGLTLVVIATGLLPTFTKDIARAVNVVHVVETNGSYAHNQELSSYVSLFSSTPGKLVEESKSLKDEGFDCGRKTIDFVSFTVKYGCFSFKDTDAGWSKLEIPSLDVESDSRIDSRITRFLVDTKQSKRWSLAINMELISDFTFEVASEELVQTGKKSSVDGWHIIQFSGGKGSPTRFYLNLFWTNNATQKSHKPRKNTEASPLLLKLRTDVDRITPKAARVLEKLPPWCALFGKSTSPYTLAFLTSLSADF